MQVMELHRSACGKGLSPATICKVRQVARRVSRRLRSAHLDCHDIEQELILAILQRSARFDSGKSQPQTFHARCLRNKAAEIVRYELRKKRRPKSMDPDSPQRIVPRNEDAESQEMRGLAPAEPLAAGDGDDQQRAMDVESVTRALPDDLQIVCRQLMNNSQIAVRKQLGLSKREMRNALSEIRNHFEAMGLRSYL